MATKRGRGRPTKNTAKVRATLLKELKAGDTIQGACAQAGISYKTFNGWERKAEEGDAKLAAFFIEVERAKRHPWRAATRLMLAAACGMRLPADVDPERVQPETILKLLERRFPKEWGSRAALELTGQDGAPIQVDSPGERILTKLSALAAAERERDKEPGA